ncbi:hypothetical protein ACET3Z_018478 [Daucus carota]
MDDLSKTDSLPEEDSDSIAGGKEDWFSWDGKGMGELGVWCSVVRTRIGLLLCGTVVRNFLILESGRTSEDQLLDMESAIDPATPDIGREQRIVHGLLGRFRGSRNPSRYRGRPPVTPLEPEPGMYYTHVVSSSSDRGGWSHLVGTSSSPVGDVAGTFRADGWGSWPQSTVPPSTYAGDDYEGGPRGFTVRLEDDQDMSAEGQSQESYQFQDADAYRPDMSFLRDQYTTPLPQAPVPSIASQSYIFGAPAFPFPPPPVRSTPTPIQMSTFASYTSESSPWEPPSTAVAGQSEAEEQPEDEHRQQPPRAAKGKGRRCHTGSHIFGHKKK